MSLSRISTSSKERIPEMIKRESTKTLGSKPEKKRERQRQADKKEHCHSLVECTRQQRTHVQERHTRGNAKCRKERERRKISSDRKHRSSLFNDDRCFLMITNAKKKDGVFPHNYWLVGLQSKLNVFHTSSVSLVSELVFEIE